MSITYVQYKQQQQEEFNALPIFFAFSNQQFEEEMKKRGLTANDTDKVYRLGRSGGFYLRTDADEVKAYFNQPDRLPELMKDHDFAVSAFRYEMDNHEYAINYQGDWDVVSCFTSKGLEFSESKTYVDYLKEAGLEDLISAYQEAKRSHMKAAQEWS